jgi:hypothetical protein
MRQKSGPEKQPAEDAIRTFRLAAHRIGLVSALGISRSKKAWTSFSSSIHQRAEEVGERLPGTRRACCS